MNDSPSIRRLVIVGFGMIALFLGTFGIWAIFSPLEGASIAPGVVTVDSQRKTVQHLEGGIIDKILVTEGAKVDKGQPLIFLDKTQAQAQLEQLLTRQRNALARITPDC